jgi:hypothetical protein
MPRNSQSRREDLLAGRRLGAELRRDAERARHHPVSQPAEPVHLDLHHVAGLDRPGVGRGAGQQHVAGQQRDRAGDVGHQVVHVPAHLVGGPVLHDRAVDVGAQVLAAEVPAGDQPGAERRHRVRPLDPQHRPGVGVAEVVQAEVVRDGVPRDVIARLSGGDAPARAPDHDRDLALVVQVLAPGRPDHRAAVPDERRDRLVEVGGRGGQPGAELRDPAGVVQVHRHDLGRRARRQVHRVRGRHPPAVRRDQLPGVPHDLHAGPVQQDPAVFGHEVHPAAGRSNQICICPVPTEFSYSLKARPGARTAPSPSAAIIVR